MTRTHPNPPRRHPIDDRGRSRMLAHDRIGRLLVKLSLPAIVGMLVQAIYNMVDTIFVGRWVGPLGIGAVSVVFPIQMLMFACGQTIGVGGASVISRRMGAGDRQGAAETLGSMLLAALVLGAAIFMLGSLLRDPLLRLFGATEGILPYAVAYFQTLLGVAPFLSITMAANNAVRAEGNARVAMFTLLIGALLNIVLDPLLIYTLDMGIRGAALATLLSMMVTTLFLLAYFASGRSEIPVGLQHLRWNGAILREVLTVGSPALARTGAMSVTSAVLNNTLRIYGGDIAIATFGVVFRVMTFILMPLMGLNQGLQPILGFNYGAGRYRRVRSGVRLATLVAMGTATAGFVGIELFPDAIMRAFTQDAALVASGENALRYCVLLLPLGAFQVIGSGLFQALGRALPALLLSLSRPVLVLIPLVLVLPRYFGLNGVWFAFPLTDLVTFGITLVFVLAALRGLPAEAPAPSRRRAAS